MIFLAVALAPRRLPHSSETWRLRSRLHPFRWPSHSLPLRAASPIVTLSGGSLPCCQSTSPEALLRCEVVGAGYRRAPPPSWRPATQAIDTRGVCQVSRSLRRRAESCVALRA